MDYVDLHTHSSQSDGTDTPAELLSAAAGESLRAVALTDHDTVSGLDEAERAGQKLGIEVIRGCELSVQAPFGEVHLLGLWLPKDVGPMEEKLAEIRRRRDERNCIIVEKLNALGLAIAYEDVMNEAKGEVVGRPHIARALLRAGYVTHVQQAFDRYLRSGAPAYVPKQMMSANEGATLLAGLGAMGVIAHPMLCSCSRHELEQCIRALKDHGLDAIEVYHVEHTPSDEHYLKAMAEALRLGVSGGSDYHGRTKPGIRIGYGRGGRRIGGDVLEALKARRDAQGLPI